MTGSRMASLDHVIQGLTCDNTEAANRDSLEPGINWTIVSEIYFGMANGSLPIESTCI